MELIIGIIIGGVIGYLIGAGKSKQVIAALEAEIKSLAAKLKK